jgi:hypothetical protein
VGLSREKQEDREQEKEKLGGGGRRKSKNLKTERKVEKKPKQD